MNKKDFPIFKNNTDLIYLDNAATTQKPECMIRSLMNFYEINNANVHRGIYELSEKASNSYEQARRKVASFINAQSEEIIFTSGTTMGLNLVAKYLVEPQLSKDDLIVISVMDHHSNILPWQEITKNKKAHLNFLDFKDNDLDLVKLKELLSTKKVKVVSLTMMSNVIGLKSDFVKIKDMILDLSPQTLFIADAAQYIAHDKLDVKICGADIIVFSAHKLYGPLGLGVMYLNSNLSNRIEPFFKGGGMINSVTQERVSWANIPEKFEAGTPPIAQATAFIASLEYLESLGMDKIKEHEMGLARDLYLGIKELGGFNLLIKDFNADKYGPVIAFTHNSIHSHDLAQLLSYQGIAMRSGHHCAQPLHEYLGIPSSLRASIGLYNDRDDINRTLEALKQIKL